MTSQEAKFQNGITDEGIRLTIENGKRGMPAFGAVFTPAQLAMLVVRVRAFGPKPHDAGSKQTKDGP